MRDGGQEYPRGAADTGAAGFFISAPEGDPERAGRQHACFPVYAALASVNVSPVYHRARNRPRRRRRGTIIGRGTRGGARHAPVRPLPGGSVRPGWEPGRTTRETGGERSTMSAAVVYEFFRRKAKIAFLTLVIYAALC